MPHCVLEFSDNIGQDLNVVQFFGEVHQLMIGTGLFEQKRIKSRVHRNKEFYIGAGTGKEAFVVLQVSILDGREGAALEKLGNELLEVLKSAFEPYQKSHLLSITVEIREISRSRHFS